MPETTPADSTFKHFQETLAEGLASNKVKKDIDMNALKTARIKSVIEILLDQMVNEKSKIDQYEQIDTVMNLHRLRRQIEGSME